ncbi:hypothetical protein AYK26_06485 [Euryarchaeota archaeon SM23-78]|nr:MAG: hypothetical protein AYK26_06485 [Euryarchaeota archaeon SM23-78]
MKDKIYLINAGQASEFTNNTCVADECYEKIILIAASHEEAQEKIRDHFTLLKTETARDKWFITQSHKIELSDLPEKISFHDVIEVLVLAGYRFLKQAEPIKATTRAPRRRVALSRLKEK